MAVLTEEQFEKKWALKFADNTIQLFDEALFREFRQDIADSFVSLKALNVRLVRGAPYPVPYTDQLDSIPADYRILGMQAVARNGQTYAQAKASGTVAPSVTFELQASATGPVDALADEQPTTTTTVKAKWVQLAAASTTPATGTPTTSTGSVQLLAGLLDSSGESAPLLVPQDGAQDFTVPAGVQIGQVTRFEKLPSGKYYATPLARGNWNLVGTTLSVKEKANLRTGHLLDIEYLLGGASGGSTTPTTPPATGAPAAPGAVTVVALLNKLRVSTAAVAGATSYKVLRAAQAPGGALGAFTELATVSAPTFDDDSVQGDGTGYAYQLVAVSAGGSSAPSAASAVVVPFARQFVGQGAGQSTTLDSGTWQALAGATLCTQKLATPTVATGATMLVFLGGQQIGHFDYDDAYSGKPFLLIYQGQEYRGLLTTGTITL